MANRIPRPFSIDVQGQRNFSPDILTQAASHVYSPSYKALPAAPSCAHNEGLSNKVLMDAANAVGESADKKCWPGVASKPSAPNPVATTGSAAAQASNILTRVPLPVSTGTIEIFDLAKSFTASSRGPV